MTTAGFSGEGGLCTNLAPTPEPEIGHCPVGVAFQPPQFKGFSGAGSLSGEIQPGTGPITGLTFFTVTGDYWSADDPAASSTSSAPTMEPVLGLVTFTPRLPRGFQAFLNNYVISQNTDSIQTINLMGAISGGTYDMSFKGLWTPTPIPAAATAAQIQTALQAIPSIGAGNVTVTATLPNPGYPSFTVEFVNALGNQQQPPMVPDPSNLTASSGEPAVSVIELQPGSAARLGSAMIAFPARQGRIWTTGQLCSINQVDSPGVQLLANMPVLDLEFPLIYDVSFTAVSYNDTDQYLAPFAFYAPVDNTPVCITDAYCPRIPYQPPIGQSWVPGWTPQKPGDFAPGVAPVTSMSNWRSRQAKAG